MTLKDIARWNARVSLVYAVGIWTMLGTYGFFHLRRKRQEATTRSGAEDATEVMCQAELQESITFESPKQPPKEFVKTNVVVKEGFVPFSSRIYTYGKSIFGVPPDTPVEK
ncbi:small integral membrane protein 26-like [Carcharodon carcharias]|uniref:small integral membrane protein 26-like n=1 Tax=Carcharodon carcharias TaxID=13397 RepID=UPI001B7F358E|nr:small integral membrane protein 26-like [Carcharodon carcharias]